MSEPVPSSGSIIIALLFIFFIARFFYINISMIFARKKVIKSPTQENAQNVFRLLNAKLGVSINNHPKDWAKFRDMFYYINNSPDIPSELKEKIKTRLIKKGLYINNMKIIDNFNGGKKI